MNNEKRALKCHAAFLFRTLKQYKNLQQIINQNSYDLIDKTFLLLMKTLFLHIQDMQNVIVLNELLIVTLSRLSPSLLFRFSSFSLLNRVYGFIY